MRLWGETSKVEVVRGGWNFQEVIFRGGGTSKRWIFQEVIRGRNFQERRWSGGQ